MQAHNIEPRETKEQARPLNLTLEDTLRGSIQDVVFSSPDSSFCVLRLRPEEGSEEVIVVGKIIAPQPGEILLLHGTWGEHPKYGRQFQASHCERNQPQTLKGMKRFLGSGMIKGIGKKMAERLVDYFGIDTLRVIEQEPHRLHEVPGIKGKTAPKIQEAWESHKAMREVAVFFQGYGLSQHHTNKIFRQYGSRAIDLVRENPYRLATDIDGIGFVTADQIAQSLGFPLESPFRSQAALLFYLQKASEQGHVYLPRRLLIEKIQKDLEIPEALLQEAVETMDQVGSILIEPLEDGDLALYLPKLAACERGAATRLRRLLEASPPRDGLALDASIQTFEKEEGLCLAEAQREAVMMSIRSMISIITGGPGTGKTTIIRTICRLLEQKGASILLAAPTGRAAKRMAEATGLEARTLHRLLGFQPGSTFFQHNKENPLQGDMIIVDEVSMLDIYLFYALLRAIAQGTQVLLVGDIDQLPSVGPGNVLHDLISSGVLPFTRLHQIFRQKESGLIVENAHRINRGQMPILPSPSPETLLDFYFIPREDARLAVETIRELVCRRIPERFGLRPLQDIQVISPMYKGEVGVHALNEVLQAQAQAQNDQTQHLSFFQTKFYPGDRVLQLRNDYNKDVFNGDIGFVDSVDTEASSIQVRFDDRCVSYERSELDDLTLAYAISVHKSQGSEYPAVVIPVMAQHFVMLQRNLIYTAMTRGKKLVVLVGTEHALALAIQNNQIRKRYSRLFWRLRQPELPPKRDIFGFPSPP